MRPRPRSAIATAALLAVSTGVYAGTAVTYTGPNNGLWSNPANWSGGVVPNNSTFDVTIPSGVTLDYDLAAATTIESLYSYGATDVTALAGPLTVTGQIAGTIYDLGGTFQSASAQSGAIDEDMLNVSGGGTLSASATTYNISNEYYGGGTYDVLAANGSGSSLNVSSITTLTVNGQGNSGPTFQVHASNGGSVNLSGLTSVTYQSGNNGYSNFNIVQDTGGSINLAKLTTVNSTGFVANSGTLSLPSLTSVSSCGFSTNGGSINAPSLTSLIGVTLTYPLSLTTGTLIDIDESRFLVNGGVAVGNIAATTYNISNEYYGGGTYDVLAANGSGSSLNVSSITTLTVNGQGNSGPTFQVHASNGGSVNLSGLTSVTYQSGNNGYSNFNIVQDTGGSINLAKLTTVNSTGFICNSGTLSMPSLTAANASSFAAASGGAISFGEIPSTYNSKFQNSDANGQLIFNSGFVLDSTSTLALAPQSSITIFGRLTFATTNPGQFQASSAIVHVVGSDVQTVEVGGYDNGPAVYGSQGNFGYGQFVVGSTSQSSVVELVQLYNNGRTAGSQAMYCYGLGGGPAGLVMYSGSLMAISNYNVYVNEGGTLVNLQTQFASGSNILPYTFNGSNGFILKTLALAPGFYTTAVNNGNQDTWVTGNGAWDNANNWSFGITPSSNLEAVITPAVGAIVSGPVNGATVNTLIVDNTGNAATILKLNSASATVNVIGGLEVGSAGIVSLTAGTLNVGSTLTIGTIQTAPGTTFISSTILNQGGMTLSGNTTAGAVVNNNMIELSAGKHTFGPLVGPGTLQVDAGANLSAERVRQTTVTVNGTVAVRPQAGTDLEVSRITNLSISPNGQLDIANNPLILDSSTLIAVQALVTSAYNGGSWSGPGLTSSLAGTASRTEVGYVTAGFLGVTTWNGETVTSTDILVMRTLTGDANLDGVVNFADLSVVLTNYNTLNATWQNGDFNYDGRVDFADLSNVLTHYGQSLSGQTGAASMADIDWPPIEADAAAAGQVAELDGILQANGIAVPTAAVPEPAALAVAAMAGAVLARRTRRRR